MKRIGYLYEQIYHPFNLVEAHYRARKGKRNKKNVIKVTGCSIIYLSNLLANKNYKTSKYYKFTVYDPKEREISSLPYFPDRIVHHGVIIILESIFYKSFTKDTYSCIKGRGVHKALYRVKRALRDEQNTKYCLKLDIEKFYPSVNHTILKNLLKRKIKDNKLLNLLDEIINSVNIGGGGLILLDFHSEIFYHNGLLIFT